MRYYFLIVDGFGHEHRGSFTHEEEGNEAIEIAKEIALARVRRINEDRRGSGQKPGRARSVRVANHVGVYDFE